MAEEPKEESLDVFTLPEGRLINHSLFVKDKYNEKSVAAYKLEIAISATSEEIADLEEKLLDLADDQWGEGAGDNPDLILPLLSGNKLAEKRERKGKEGDAYRSMTVIRANTIFNKDGVDGPGGIQIFDEAAEAIPAARQGEIYQGCYGIAAVNVGFYEDERSGEPGIKFYLAAFQKTKDGDHLVTATDRSSLFKPTGRKPGGAAGAGAAEGGKRRRRRREG